MKRICALLLTLIVFLSACGSAGGGGNSASKWKNITKAEDITFTDSKMTYMGISGEEDWVQEILAKFKEMGGDPSFLEAVWEQRHVVLSTRITSKDAPDLYKYESGSDDWPALIIAGQLQPVDDLIDYNSPLFAHLQYIYERMKIGGKAYVLPAGTGPYRSVVLYNKNLFSDYGLETPYELYKRGEWTLSKMEEYAKKFSSQTDGTIGMYAQDEGPFIAATGRDIFAMDDKGKFYNNIRDPLIAKAMERVQRMYRENTLTMDKEGARDLMLKGSMAMWVAPFWTIDTLKILTVTGALEFVPFPKDPEADKWYLDGLVDAFCIPSGAKNTDAALAWVAIQTEYNKNEAKIKAEEAANTKKYNMAPEFGPLLTSMSGSSKFELNFLTYHQFTQFNEKFFTEFWESFIAGGQSWSTIVEKLSPVVDDELKKLEAIH